MKIQSDATPTLLLQTRTTLGLSFLIYAHLVIWCLSLVFVAGYFRELYPVIKFEETRVWSAIFNVAPFAVVSVLFTFSRFSFGYLVGFYFYTMVCGYLWIVEFSEFHYNKVAAIASASVSALAFLLPALFIASPIKQIYVLSPRQLNFLLNAILALTVATLAVGVSYNFRITGVAKIYNFRDQLQFPILLRYAMGILPSALLPFAFACFTMQQQHCRAATSLILLLLFFPITLTKLTLFAPIWLLGLSLLSRNFDARTSTVLSLFVPVCLGVLLALLAKAGVFPYGSIHAYFSTVNLRMAAVPSAALDVYNDFFSNHVHTHFCQISFLKPLVDCPYKDQLGVVIKNAYDAYNVGNFNASLFATEGIASVGPVFAPFAVLGCGLILSIGNCVSSGLPSRFILLSGAMLPPILVDVPLTTTLVTHGAAILFLLWYITPRSILDRNSSK